jgi:hypothetical protein
MEIKLSGRYTWEAIHRVSLINIVLPLMFPTSRIEPGRMGLPENNNKYKAEYTNTQQDLLDKKNKTRHASLFDYWVCFAKSD